MLTRLLALVLLGGLVAAPACAGEPPGQPDILIIISDDMGFSDVGCYGGEIETPNLDTLAANGLRFTQFYNTARCCPTRASLLTGLYPHQADMGHMTVNRDVPGYRGDLSRDAVTIPEVLRTAGYATYMTGKWHVTSHSNLRSSKHNWPRQRGFDRFYGTIKGGGSYYDPAMLVRDDTPISPVNDPEYQPENYYYTDAISDQSARFIREHAQQQADRPLFMYIAYTAPHWPLHAPEEAVAKYRGKYDGGYEPIRAARFERMRELGVIDSKWKLSEAPQAWQEQQHREWEARCMEVYAAQIDVMDQGIGRIVQALRETGRLDNTLILFLHDNGGCAENMGRSANARRHETAATQPMAAHRPQLEIFPLHTRDGRPILDGPQQMPGPATSYIAYGRGWANVSNTPFREYKHWVHEGGISTPLIAHWPARLQRAGQLEHQPGHLIDLMATCVDVAGADYPEQKYDKDVLPMQGLSLAPAFSGESIGQERAIFFEHEGNRAVRKGPWKLVAKDIDGPWELYNLEDDRSETNDLAARYPQRVKDLAEVWQQWAERNNVLPLRPWDSKGSD